MDKWGIGRNDISETTVREIADEALEAFWQVVVQHFPKAVSGDLHFEIVMKLQFAAEEALACWIDANVSEPAKVGD